MLVFPESVEDFESLAPEERAKIKEKVGKGIPHRALFEILLECPDCDILAAAKKARVKLSKSKERASSRELVQ